jgi:hypothetical protein
MRRLASARARSLRARAVAWPPDVNDGLQLHAAPAISARHAPQPVVFARLQISLPFMTLVERVSWSAGAIEFDRFHLGIAASDFMGCQARTVLGKLAHVSQPGAVMRYRTALMTSSLVAAAIGVALILRPSRTIILEMTPPGDIPPAMRAVLEKRMERHGAQMGELVSRLLILDYDGAARVAGAIYDEPAVARPLARGELNQFLPERFFVLQDELKTQTRRVVTAAAKKDAERLAEEFGAMTKTCVSCHSVYLYERPPLDVPGPGTGHTTPEPRSLLR